VAHLLEDEVMHKMSKLELPKGSAAVSKLKISKKKPLAILDGDSKNFLSPPERRMWHITLVRATDTRGGADKSLAL
jgi:hypothetical protein